MSAPTTTATRDLDVLSFGEALVDFFPDRTGVPLAECDVFHRHLGGAPCNVAVGLSRLGARVGLMTLVGPDAFGTFVRDRLVSEGIDIRGVGVHRTAKTGVTFVAVGAHGERSFLFFRHPSADQMIAEHDVDASIIARAHVLHVGSSTMAREPSRGATLRAIELARRAGCLISTDPNWRAHLWENPAEAAPMLQRLVAECDVVKISDDELAPLTGVTDPEAGAKKLRALGCPLVVVTLGARGCYVDSAQGSDWLPGEHVEVVDTTGAGDGFVAGLLSTLAPLFRTGRRPADLTLDEIRGACRAGNKIGAAVVTALGATTGLPARR
ncbi:MAG: putative fructokinase [Myxococcales bacterium]|nr:putative fructokinase [Myxococcales bacterium]